MTEAEAPPRDEPPGLLVMYLAVMIMSALPRPLSLRSFVATSGSEWRFASVRGSLREILGSSPLYGSDLVSWPATGSRPVQVSELLAPAEKEWFAEWPRHLLRLPEEVTQLQQLEVEARVPQPGCSTRTKPTVISSGGFGTPGWYDGPRPMAEQENLEFSASPKRAAG